MSMGKTTKENAVLPHFCIIMGCGLAENVSPSTTSRGVCNRPHLRPQLSRTLPCNASNNSLHSNRLWVYTMYY
jgi:hypothetical protein